MTVDARLEKANVIAAKIETLQKEQDVLLDDIVSQAIVGNNLAEINELLHKLPSGFHRSELRTWLNMQEMASPAP